jgi:hypothetical protein
MVWDIAKWVIAAVCVLTILGIVAVVLISIGIAATSRDNDW